MGKKSPINEKASTIISKNLLERIPTVPKGSSTSALCTDCWSIILCWPFLSLYIDSLTIKKGLSTLSCFWLGFFSTFFSSSFARSRSWQEIAQDTMKDCNHALGRLQISHPFWGNKKKPFPAWLSIKKIKTIYLFNKAKKAEKWALILFFQDLKKSFIIWYQAWYDMMHHFEQ